MGDKSVFFFSYLDGDLQVLLPHSLFCCCDDVGLFFLCLPPPTKQLIKIIL